MSNRSIRIARREAESLAYDSQENRIAYDILDSASFLAEEVTRIWQRSTRNGLMSFIEFDGARIATFRPEGHAIFNAFVNALA